MDEQARIDWQLAYLGLGDAAMAKIAAKLDWPLDVDPVAALATSEDEATQIYATSLLVVDEAAPVENGYLAVRRTFTLGWWRICAYSGLVAHLRA